MAPAGVPGGGLKPLKSKPSNRQTDGEASHMVPSEPQQQTTPEQFVRQQAANPGGAIALARELRSSLAGHVNHDNGSHHKTLDPKLYYESVPPSDWRPDPSDSYLSLYHRAYCNVMDVLVPPLVFASMAALANVMPMLLLLPTTPFVFVGITFCCLTKGAGMSPFDIGESRLTISLVLCFELLLPYVYVTDVAPLIPELWASHVMLLSLNAAILAMHVWLVYSNPGRLKPSAVDPEKLGGEAVHDHGKVNTMVKPSDVGDAEVDVPPELVPLYSDCDTCHMRRPLRARHCSACRACIERQDHHCPAIHNCVGAGNARVFAAWQALVFLGQVMFLLLTVRALWRQARSLAHASSVDHPTLRHIAGQWGAAVGLHRPMALFAVAVGFMAVGTSYLVGRVFYCIAGNLTTAELLGRRKYVYLRDSEGTFFNRFDAGPAANCTEFWSNGLLDWRAARAPAVVVRAWMVCRLCVHDRQQARLEARMPGVWSVTAMVQGWEAREALLQQARAQARRNREAWLLEQYGGVKDGHLHEDKQTEQQAPCCSNHHH